MRTITLEYKSEVTYRLSVDAEDEQEAIEYF